MGEFDRYSRVDKFEKRRKNTKTLTILIVLGCILVIALAASLIFGGGDGEKQTADQTNQSSDTADRSESKDQNTNDSNQSDETNEGSVNADDDQNEPADNNAGNDEAKLEKLETPDDPNVLNAYKGDWEASGTVQEEPHQVNYDENTQDRKEMEQAIRIATGLEENNMTVWWLERGGDQKVIATVSDKDDKATYRTYLTWIPDKGWRTEKLEVLKENDQKYRFK